MTDAAPLYRLIRLAALLDAGTMGQDGQILAAQLSAWLAGNAPTLDAALDVANRPGQSSIRVRVALVERDRLVRQAASHFKKPVADNMHRAWTRYAASAWRRDRLASECPEGYRNRSEAVFFQIMTLRADVLSRRRIRAILAVSSGFSWPEQGSNLQATGKNDVTI